MADKAYPNRYIFPVVVEKAEDGGLGMYFPDFPGTAIVPKDLTDGIKRAKELLAHRIVELEDQDQDVPNPSNPEDIELYSPSDRIIYVDVFMPPYRDEFSEKMVKKTLTIPNWLNKLAEERKVNFSRLLQDSLKSYLGVKDRHDVKDISNK